MNTGSSADSFINDKLNTFKVIKSKKKDGKPGPAVLTDNYLLHYKSMSISLDMLILHN